MAFEDFLKQNFPQTLGGGVAQNPVPGMSAPVQFMPMPGTRPTDAAAAQVQQQDQAVMAQQQVAQNSAVAQQLVEASRQRVAREEDRGGGFLQPFRNAANTIMDFPQNMGAAISNLGRDHNYLNPMAWGQVALTAASPIFGLTDIPNNYWKEVRGEILYRAAAGDQGFFDILGTLMPMGARTTLSGIYMGLNAALPDDTKSVIVRAHDEGYKGFHGGTGVYEAATGITDDWHPLAKYAFRITNEVLNDPTTWIGVGAAMQASKVGQLGRIGRGEEAFNALSRTGKVGAVASDIRQTKDPIMAADAVMRGVSYIPDQLMFNVPGKIIKGGATKAGLGGLFERSSRAVRAHGESLQNETIADFARTVEDDVMPVDPPMKTVEGGQQVSGLEFGDPRRGTYTLPEGEKHAPQPLEGFTASIDVAPESKVRIRYTYTERGTGDQGFIDVMENGTMRVLPPREDVWEQVLTIPEGVDRIAMTVPNPPATQRSPLGANPTFEAQKRYAGAGTVPKDARPPRDIYTRDMTDGQTKVVEITHRTKNRTLYARQQPDGRWRVSDERGAAMLGPDVNSYSDAYDVAVGYLLDMPYQYQTDPYGYALHPAAVPNPDGDRIIDEAYRLTQDAPDDPRWQWFWKRYREAEQRYAPVLDVEQDRIDRNAAGQLRRDLEAGDPAARERGLTVDTARKTLAETNLAITADVLATGANGQQRVVTPRRGWKGSPSRQVADFLYGTSPVKGDVFKDDLNMAEAIREAMLTDNDNDARMIIDYFTQRRKKPMIKADEARAVLLPGAQLHPKYVNKEGYVNIGRVLEANRQARREMLANPEQPVLGALPMGPLAPPQSIPRVERIPRPSSGADMSTPPADYQTGPAGSVPLPPDMNAVRNQAVDADIRWRNTPAEPGPYSPVLQALAEANRNFKVALDGRRSVSLEAKEKALFRAQHYVAEEQRLRNLIENPGQIQLPPATRQVERDVLVRPPMAPRLQTVPVQSEPLGMSTPTGFRGDPDPLAPAPEPPGLSTPSRLPTSMTRVERQAAPPAAPIVPEAPPPAPAIPEGARPTLIGAAPDNKRLAAYVVHDKDDVADNWALAKESRTDGTPPDEVRLNEEYAKLSERVLKGANALKKIKDQGKRDAAWAELKPLIDAYEELSEVGAEGLDRVLASIPDAAPVPRVAPEPAAPSMMTLREYRGDEFQGDVPNLRGEAPDGRRLDVRWNGIDEEWASRVDSAKGGTTIWRGPGRSTRQAAEADIAAYLRGEKVQGAIERAVIDRAIPDGQYQVWRGDTLIGVDRTPELADELRHIHDQQGTGSVRVYGPGEYPPTAASPEPTFSTPDDQPPLAQTRENFVPGVEQADEGPQLTRFQKSGQTRRMNRLAGEPPINTGADAFAQTERVAPRGLRPIPGQMRRQIVDEPIDPSELPDLPEPWNIPEGTITMDVQPGILPWDRRPGRSDQVEVPGPSSPPEATIVADSPLVRRVKVKPPGTLNKIEDLWLEVVTADPDQADAALDSLVYEIAGGNVARSAGPSQEDISRMAGLNFTPSDFTPHIDDALSGNGVYTIRDDVDGLPAVQIRRVGKELVVTAPGGSDDPVVKNIVARAGDRVPVRVEQGMGDGVGRPMGLETEMTSGVPEPLWDPVYRLWRMTRIDDEERDLLSTVIPISEGKNAKTMRVADLYLLNRAQSETMDEAIRKTITTFRKFSNAQIREQKGASGAYAKLGKLLRMYDAVTDNIRERLMFNPYTGGVSAMLDHVGDTVRLLSVGELGAAKKLWKIRGEFPDPTSAAKRKVVFLPNLKAGIASARGDNSYLLGTDAGRIVGGIGLDIPLELGPNIGREGLDRHRGMAFDNMIQQFTPDVRTQRQLKRVLAASGFRGSDFIMELRTGGDIARRFAVFSEEIAKQLPKSREAFYKDVAEVARRRPDFNEAAFKREIGEVFSPDGVRLIAQRNGLDRGQAEHLARRWKAQHKGLRDAGLAKSKQVLFSYEQTNIDQVLRRVFLFHYWYTRASVAYTRTIIRNPYLYANYMRMTEGMDKLAEDQPTSVKGMIKAFTGPGGYAIFMDPLKAVSTAVTFRREAFKDGDDTAFDEFLSTTGLFFHPMLAAATAVLGKTSNSRVDPLATFQIRRVGGAVINAVNAETGIFGGSYLGTPFQDAMGRAVQELSDVFGSANYAEDTAATEKVMIRNGIMDRVMERHNIESGTEFGLWPAQAVAELQEAFDSFDTGRPNPDADGAYRDWARGNLTRTAVSVALPVTTSMRSETRDARSRGARAGISGNPYQRENQITAAGEGLGTDLAIQDARFDSLFPSNEMGRVSESPLTGQTQRDVLSDPTMAEYNTFRDWRSAARDLGPGIFRDRMRRISPAYDAFIRQQEQELGDVFAEDPEYFDNVSTGYEAYVASQGEQVSRYDPASPPALDVSRVDPATFASGFMAGGSQQQRPEQDLASTITGQLIGYHQQQAEFNRLVQQYFGQEVVFDLLSPQGQAMIRQQLGPLGVRIPSLGEEAAGYQAWSRVQPIGGDTSIAAYVRWAQSRPAMGQSTRAVPMMART
jgi:hypothetical protein